MFFSLLGLIIILYIHIHVHIVFFLFVIPSKTAVSLIDVSYCDTVNINVRDLDSCIPTLLPLLMRNILTGWGSVGVTSFKHF